VSGKWAAVVFFACHSPPREQAKPPPPVDAAPASADAAPLTTLPTAKPLPNVATDWCLEGFLAIDEETCFLPPAIESARPRRLLVYLHGIIPPAPKNAPQKENVFTAVKNAASRAGAAALVPRGIRGIGPTGSKDWWAWPTSPDAHAKHGAALVKRITEAKAKLEEALGAPFAKTYLAGSSNGAYFAVNLALRGEMEIDGLGAMSGGAPTAIKRTKPLAVYVGYGTQDVASKNGGLALAKAAEGAGWPVKVAEHPFPHGAREIYIDEAFSFWDGVP
jgi:predicted esterase